MKVVSRRKGEVHEAGDRSQDVAEVVRDLPREPADRLPLLALDPPSLELKRSGSRRALPRTAVCRSPLHVNRAVATMFSDTGRKIAVRLIADAERYVAQRLEPEAASGRRTGSCRAGLSCLRRVAPSCHLLNVAVQVFRRECRAPRLFVDERRQHVQTSRVDRAQPTSRHRLVSAVVVLLLALSAMSISVTGAIFTDTASVGSNALTAGTIDITTSPVSALLTAANLAPGDLIQNSLTLTNAGSLQVRYAIQRSATNADLLALRDVLRLRIGLRGGASCDFPYYTTAGATTTLTDDTQLYEGLGLPGTATNTVGDVAQGNQAGDRVLAAAASEVLCFSVVLPLSTGNLLQAATSTATFAFVSEQTLNN